MEGISYAIVVSVEGVTVVVIGRLVVVIVVVVKSEKEQNTKGSNGWHFQYSRVIVNFSFITT